MTAAETCPACGLPVEDGKGLRVGDAALVHDEQCLRGWMLSELKISGRVAMYPADAVGPLVVNDDASEE